MAIWEKRREKQHLQGSSNVEEEWVVKRKRKGGDIMNSESLGGFHFLSFF